jgi:hypothetical protein
MEAPAYSLASRAKELKKFSTPAPGSYEVSPANIYSFKDKDSLTDGPTLDLKTFSILSTDPLDSLCSNTDLFPEGVRYTWFRHCPKDLKTI